MVPEKKKKIQKELRMFLCLTLASAVIGFNIKSFVKTGGLFPGGFSGLTILIQQVASQFFGIEIPYSAIYLPLNLIPAYIGFRYISKKFTIYSFYVVFLSSILTDVFPAATITYDTLLISIFGGIIHGLTISICLNANATSGGTDFISIFLSERRGIDSFNIILGFNAVILCIAGLIFGWDKALYSIIFQYASTAVLHVLYKKYQQSTLFIVTTKPAKVCEAIYKVSMHGATILEGEGSYEQCERNVVYSVVSAAQTKKVIRAVRDADPDVFINEVKTQKLSGRFYQPKEQ